MLPEDKVTMSVTSVISVSSKNSATDPGDLDLIADGHARRSAGKDEDAFRGGAAAVGVAVFLLEKEAVRHGVGHDRRDEHVLADDGSWRCRCPGFPRSR